MSAKYLAGVRFAANQDKLVTKLHHGVVLDGQVVGLVVAAALIRQIARTHRPMKFRSLEVGAYVKKKKKKVILANCKKITVTKNRGTFTRYLVIYSFATIFGVLIDSSTQKETTMHGF